MDISPRTHPLELVTNLFSDGTLTKKAYLNAAASMLEYITSLVVGLLLTPIMVIGLGDYSFGLWQVLNRLVGYLSPASGRPTHALKWTLANRQDSNDYDQKRRYVGSTLVIWAGFLPVLLTVGAIVGWSVPAWIHAPVEHVWTIRIVCLLLVVNTVVNTLASVPQAVLQGGNMGYKRMGLSAGLIFLTAALTWLAIQLGWGIVGVAVAVVIGTILTGVFFLRVLPSYVQWFGAARPLAEDLRQMLGRSWWFLGWNLVTSLLLASDVVVLGLFHSIESVTNYTITKYVPEMMISIIANLVFAIMPGLGGIIGSGDLKRAVRLRSEILLFIWLVVTGMGAGILLWNRSFINLWMQSDRYSGALPNLLLVVSVIQLVFIRSDANIIDLTLRLSQKVLLGLLSVTVSIVTASLLVGYFKLGIVGLCFGIMAGRTILTIGYPLLINRLLGMSGGTQWKALIRPLLVTIAFFSIAVGVDVLSPTIMWTGARHWIIFFLSAGLSGIGFIGLAFFMGLTTDQRASVIRRARMAYSQSDSNTIPMEK
jgi:O-antigen/teichoic acid export membrane protein